MGFQLYVIVGEVMTLLLVQMNGLRVVRDSENSRRYTLAECCVVCAVMTVTWPLVFVVALVQMVDDRRR